MFDAYEAVENLIDDINEDYYIYREHCEDAYNEIYEELCERVNNDELTLREAEIINEAAIKKFLTPPDPDEDEEKPLPKKLTAKKKAAIAAGTVLGVGTAAYVGKSVYDKDLYVNSKKGELRTKNPVEKQVWRSVADDSYDNSTKLGKKLIKRYNDKKSKK